jgi:hypothetical protein
MRTSNETDTPFHYGEVTGLAAADNRVTIRRQVTRH